MEKEITILKLKDMIRYILKESNSKRFICRRQITRFTVMDDLYGEIIREYGNRLIPLGCPLVFDTINEAENYLKRNDLTNNFSVTKYDVCLNQIFL